MLCWPDWAESPLFVNASIRISFFTNIQEERCCRLDSTPRRGMQINALFRKLTARPRPCWLPCNPNILMAVATPFQSWALMRRAPTLGFIGSTEEAPAGLRAFDGWEEFSWGM